MNRQLSEIGNVPVMTSVIKSLYPELKSPDNKVEDRKRSLYVVNPEHSGKILSCELIADHLYAPSYISMPTSVQALQQSYDYIDNHLVSLN